LVWLRVDAKQDVSFLERRVASCQWCLRAYTR
jgi:hypothetical protein